MVEIFETGRLLFDILDPTYYVCTVFGLAVEAGDSSYFPAVSQTYDLTHQGSSAQIKSQPIEPTFLEVRFKANRPLV